MIGNKLGPVDRTVSIFIDKSYPVIKEVYLNLEAISSTSKYLTAIDTVSKELDEIQNVQNAANSLTDINANLSKLLDIQSNLTPLKAVGNNIGTLVTIHSNLNELLNVQNYAEQAEDAYESVLEKEQELIKLSGTYFTPQVSTSGILSWTNTGGLTNPTPVSIVGPRGAEGPQGKQGIQGPQGVQGPQGNPGTGLALAGEYESLEALKQAHPTGVLGDAYYIGGNVYFWSPESSEWVNAGPIRGPQGPQGIQGVQGEQGVQGVQGKQGEKGDPGAVYVPSMNSSGVLSWTNNGNLENPDSFDFVDKLGIKDPATESAKGIVELASNDEVKTGTDNTRAVTPLKAFSNYLSLNTQTLAEASQNTVLTNLGVFEALKDLITENGGTVPQNLSIQTLSVEKDSTDPWAELN